MDSVEFWDKVNFLIKKNNMTQSSLSVLCGFNQRRIQNLSAGNRLPDIQEGVLIAKALNTTVEYLVTGVEPEPVYKVPDDLMEVMKKYVE